MRAIVFDFFGTLTDPGAEIFRRTAFEAHRSRARRPG
jgi:FMN phosphatase YigB (HAD superfamily)